MGNNLKINKLKSNGSLSYDNDKLSIKISPYQYIQC